MRSPAELLQDILDAIERVERYAARGRQAFDSDELIQTWIVHHIEIIGEAAGRLGRTFHDSHPEIAWPQVVAMRNVLVHEYFGIDLDEVWATVVRDLPDLKGKIQTLLTSPGSL